MMTLQQLTYFCAVAQTLHYTKASQILHVAQPSLSYSINKLEQELGAPLFHRQGKKLSLTACGEAFLPYVQQALETIQSGVKKVELLKDPSVGTINLGYIYRVSFYFFHSLISRFMSLKENHEITFQFSQGVKADLLQRLHDGRIDLAIAGSYEAPFLQKADLFEQEIFLVVPQGHRLSSLKSVALKELKGEPLIFPRPTSGLRDVLDRAFAEAGFTPRIVFEAEECNAMVAFVNSGQGLTFTPHLPSLQDYNLSVLRVADPPLRQHVSLLWMDNRYLSPTAERFKDFALQHRNRS